jgi:hypothetical protein
MSLSLRGYQGSLKKGARLFFTSSQARGIAKHKTVGKDQAQAKAGMPYGDPRAQ